MRGKRIHKRAVPSLPGITPADAGKTATANRTAQCAEDHPRGCGENHCIIPHSNDTLGSPPRMRGKPVPSVCVAILSRITPADAGKTESTMQTHRRRKDHPRGCGENCSSWFFGFSFPGSPPRMRGKQSVATSFVAFQRITPADAGKTGRFAHFRYWTRDHPRGCGENNTAGHKKPAGTGSPPRMRGKPCAV